MDRCRDYFSFAVWFAGVGYAVLWPFTAVGHGSDLFGASMVCGRANGGITAALCALPHLLSLPVGLHVLGLAAAMLVAARLARRLLRRWRSRPTVIPAAALDMGLPGAIPAGPVRAMRPMRKVKPRRHFGLRGAPR